MSLVRRPRPMPRIFICYRREDTAYAAQQIYKKLADHYGDDAVVFDVDSIPKGFDFAKYLELQVQLCDVLLAVIGGQWLRAESDGTRRIDDSNDSMLVFVHEKKKNVQNPIFAERG